jgi:hypothetical protein
LFNAPIRVNITATATIPGHSLLIFTRRGTNRGRGAGVSPDHTNMTGGSCCLYSKPVLICNVLGSTEVEADGTRLELGGPCSPR